VRCWLTILSIFIFGQSSAQTLKYIVGPSEYTTGFIKVSNHAAYTLTTDNTVGGTGSAHQNGSGTPAIGIPSLLVTTPSNKQMAGVCTGLHDGGFWSLDSGRVFMYGLSSNCQLGNGLTTGPTSTYEILTDVNGHQFQNIDYMTAGWGPVSGVPFYAALKTNGGDTVWAWGNLTNLGGSSCATPTPFIVAVGKTVSKIYAYNSSMQALCTDGSVYAIGGTDDYAANTGVNATPTTFTQITGMNPIAYLAKGNAFTFAVTTTGDSLYAFGEYGWLCKNAASTSGTSAVTAPLLVNSYFPSSIFPIDTMVAAHVGYAILNTSNQLFTGGSNEVGICGTGPTIIWPLYTAPTGTTPYNGSPPEPWNWYVDMGQYVNQCAQIAKGANVTWYKLFGGPLYSFYFLFEDVNGNLYGAGRNKAAGLPAGIIFADSSGSRIAAAYHMGLNVVRLASFPDPLSLTKSIVASCPGCADGESPISGTTPCTYGTDAPSRPNTNLHCNLVVTPFAGGFNWSVSTSTTDASHQLMFPMSFIVQTGGTTINLGVTAGESGSVIGVPAGTYTITDTLVDNSWDTVEGTASFTVPSATQTGFYFAAAGSGTACTLGSPCAPSYFNTVYATESGGDTNYLNRGDIFPIEMIANVSGVLGNPIVTRPYGTGPEPIIGGMTTQTGWTNIGSNVWQVAYTSGVIPNLLVANDTLWNVARTPNFLSGYHIATSTTSNTITDAVNAGTVSTGDSIVYRPNPYTFNHRKVSGVAGSVITVSSNFGTIAGGLGWFKYNTLPDTAYEYRMNGGNLQVYNVNTPTNITTPTVDTCLLSEGTYQEWDSLHFSGGNNAGIILAFQANSGNVFKWDTVDYCFDAFQMRTQGGWSLINCHILHCVDGGVQKQGNSNYNNTYLSDTLIDIGMRPGMGGENGDQNYSALVAGDSGSIVKYCEINQAGYIGIANYGSGYKTDSNWVNFFCQVAEDGGGLYTYAASSISMAHRPENIGDVLSNGGSYLAHNGMNPTLTPAGYGVYNDNYSSNIYSSGVTVYNVTAAAFFCHGPNDTFVNCTAYGSGYSDPYLYQISSGPVISGTYIENNVFASATWSSAAVRYATVGSNIATMATSNNNQIVGFNGAPNPFWTFATGDPGTFRTLAGWTALTGYDVNSTYTTGVLGFYYNPTGVSSTQKLNNLYKDLSGAFHWGSITLAPYTSQVLINVGVGIQIQIGSKLNVL
jgi:hypothetical protein